MSFLRRLSWPGRIGLALVATGAVGGLSLVSRVGAQAETPLTWRGLSAVEVALYEEAALRRLDYLPNQVLVKFRNGVGQAGQQRALMALRGRPDIGSVKWAGRVAVVTDLSQANPHILAQQLREQPEVQYAEPNYLHQPDAMTPTDPDYSSLQWNFPAIDLPRAWDINPGADGVTVAVVDTGVTTFNGTILAPTWNGSAIVTYGAQFGISPDFSSSRFVSPQDFVLGFGSTVLDTDKHGTHVAGTVGEDTNNGVLVAGIAYNTKIMPVKVCASYWDVQFSRSAAGVPGFAPLGSGGCAVANEIAGIEWAADHGADVINFSIGGTSALPTVQDAINYAVGKGVFVAISAGNNYENGNPTGYPAKYAETIDGAMAVGSVGRTLGHAYYSSSGSYVEIAAPGGDQRAGGDAGGIYQSTLRRTDTDPNIISLIFPRFDRYDARSLQGTSMASPHVAGIAALIYSQLGSAATPKLVEEIIKKTAKACTATSCDAKGTGRTDFFGVGLIQPRTALFGVGLRK